MSNCIRVFSLLLDFSNCLLALISPLVKWTFILQLYQALFSCLFPHRTRKMNWFLKPHVLFTSLNSDLIDLWCEVPIISQKTKSSIFHLFCAPLSNSPSCLGQRLSLHPESQLFYLFLLWILYNATLLSLVPFPSFPLCILLFPFLSKLNLSLRFIISHTFQFLTTWNFLLRQVL